jgi:hypothetical protein
MVLLVAAAIGGGCSTTTVGAAPSADTQRWLREHAASDMQIVATDAPGKPVDRTHLMVEAASPTDIRFKTGDDRITPLARVQRVVVVNRAPGAVEGALIGLAVGVTVGLVMSVGQAGGAAGTCEAGGYCNGPDVGANI